MAVLLGLRRSVSQKYPGDPDQRLEEEIRKRGLVSIAAIQSAIVANSLTRESRQELDAIFQEFESRARVGALLTMFEVTDYDILLRVAQIIGYVRSRKVTKSLIRVLRRSSHPKQRAALMVALGELADRRAIHCIGECLLNRNEEPVVRDLAAEALMSFIRRRPKRIVKLLGGAIDDPDVEVRWTVVRVLSAARHRGAALLLERMLEDVAVASSGEVIGELAAECLGLRLVG